MAKFWVKIHHMWVQRNTKPYKILKSLLVGGGVIAVSLMSPARGARIVQDVTKAYLRKKKFERNRFLRDLRRLQVRKLIDFKENSNGTIKIILTARGEKMMLQYRLDDISIDRGKAWDGRWRLVIFDIPHHMRRARDAFRKKLNELGFYPLQRSVFLMPYQCEKEIEFICAVFNIRHCILILYLDHFEGEEKLKHHFGI